MQIVRISLSNSKFLKVNDNDLYSFYCPFSGLDLTGEEVDPKLYPKNLLCHLLMNEVEEPIYASKEIKKHLKKFVKTYDLRANKNRYDDIIFTIDKSNT